MQEDIGLQGVTDGEFRRHDWLMDFKFGIGGVEKLDAAAVKVPFRSETGGVDWSFVPYRIAQPPASQGHDLRGGFRVPEIGHEGDAEAHDSLAEHDALPGRARHRPRGLSRHGAVFRRSRARSTSRRSRRSPRSAAPTCRWTTPAWRCSTIRRAAPRSGRAPTPTTCATSRCSTAVLAAKPPGMTICTHLCRGNFRSAWLAEGSYEHVAEAMFSELDVDGFFLEYDDARSGRLRAAALRAEGPHGGARPRHHQEARARSRRTISSAASTRRRSTCRSTSSASRRNAASPRPPRATCSRVDDQIAKLRLVVETAREVWG